MESINMGKEKFDNWFYEKNFFIDVLDKIEKKIGVKRFYLFFGNL